MEPRENEMCIFVNHLNYATTVTHQLTQCTIKIYYVNALLFT